VTATRIASIRTRAERLCDSNYTEYPGYSGRGMAGATAPFACTTEHGPLSHVGAKLLGLSPSMRVDNLGRDFIYYIDAPLDK
jgi:hypothetical protein